MSRAAGLLTSLFGLIALSGCVLPITYRDYTEIRVTGKTVNARTGHPIPNVKVFSAAQPENATLTDRGGAFDLRPLATRRFPLFILPLPGDRSWSDTTVFERSGYRRQEEKIFTWTPGRPANFEPRRALDTVALVPTE